jgi:group I intron endonuclease
VTWSHTPVSVVGRTVLTLNQTSESFNAGSNPAGCTLIDCCTNYVELMLTFLNLLYLLEIVNMANLNNKKKYHFIYKTTNLLNNKYYIGMHSTNNIDDNYVGSGKLLRYSIRKYGKHNFKCDILEYFDSREELVLKEKELVNQQILKDRSCLNLREGGSGGRRFTKKEYKLGIVNASNKNKWLWENDKEWVEKEKKRRSKSMLEYYLRGNRAPFTNKKHKPETIQHMSLSKKGTHMGKDNHAFGKIWITNGKENKRISKEDIIPDNWKLGRNLITKGSQIP